MDRDYGELRTVELIEVIHVTYLTGEGKPESPFREVDEYWSKSGKILARFDSWKEDKGDGE